MHVLVVDDEPAIVEMFDIGLSALGHRVSSAADGADVVELVGTHHPDVVVLDFMMPGTDGLSVLERLQRNSGPEAGVPVVMCSAKSRPHDALRALAAGATAYVLKPIEVDALEKFLMQVVTESPADRELRRARALADLREYAAGPGS